MFVQRTSITGEILEPVVGNTCATPEHVHVHVDFGFLCMYFIPHARKRINVKALSGILVQLASIFAKKTNKHHREISL